MVYSRFLFLFGFLAIQIQSSPGFPSSIMTATFPPCQKEATSPTTYICHFSLKIVTLAFFFRFVQAETLFFVCEELMKNFTNFVPFDLIEV